MRKNNKYVGVVFLFWVLIVGIHVHGLSIVLPDEYYCCKKIIDPAYDYGPYQSPYACENISMSKEVCQRYIDEQDEITRKSVREYDKQYEKPARIAFFIILGILVFAIIGIGVVLYWIISCLRKHMGKKQKNMGKKKG